MAVSSSLTICFLRILFRLWDIFITLLFRLANRGKRDELPPITDLLLLEPVTSLATKIRTKKLKAKDLVQSYITRIKEVQPIINAVVDERFIEAIEDAKKIDEFIASGQKSEQELAEDTPFLGVPFTVKNSIGVKGMIQSCGIKAEKDTRAKEDAGVVALMRRAGAIPIASSNLSQMCSWCESSNNLYGTTHNPYDTSHVAGGSSGGEGALMASAGSVIGIGSDMGGSIRIPSFYNGVFGHKPTKDIVPMTGKFPDVHGELNSIMTTGPICRYGTDLLPLMKVMAGTNISRLKLDTKVNMKFLKFYYIEEISGHPFLSPVHPEIKAAINKVRSYIHYSYNIKAQKVKLDKLKYSGEMWTYKIRDSDAPTYESLLGKKGTISVCWEVIKWLLRCSDHSFSIIAALVYEKILPGKDSEQHSYFLNMLNDIKNELRDLLEDDGILIMPGFPEPAVYHNQSFFKPFSVVYTCLFNILGLPVTQCPLGLSSEGLPFGVQIISGMYNDHLTIAFAIELEKAFGGWISPSAIL